MKFKRLLICAILASSLLLTSCGEEKKAQNDKSSPAYTGEVGETVLDINDSFDGTVSDIFSKKDLDTEFSEKSSVSVKFEGDKAVASSKAVSISGSTVKITSEGTYILYGQSSDGKVIIDAPSDAKVTLVLNGLTLTSTDFAPIYAKDCDKLFILIADKTENTLKNVGCFTKIDENNVDAVIFSKQDLTLKGNGSLSVTTSAGAGIVSKDELKITGGNIMISATTHGIDANDLIAITSAVLDITAVKDGIHAENNDNTELGNLYVVNTTATISAGGDGLSSSASLFIESGTYDIVTGGGYENGKSHESNNMPGGPGGPGGAGGRPRTTTEESSVSSKAIKAAATLSIKGGSFKLDASDDAIHSDNAVLITDGTLEISSGDDALHADSDVAIRGGIINISNSYEGIEATNVEISGGDITVKSTDDGINASGGNDESGFGGGRPGQDHFSSNSTGSVTFTGGTTYINAGGDGIDANGTLKMTGGVLTICGPTQGDTSVLDFDKIAEISGGVFVGTGSMMMAQTFTSSSQGVVSLNIGSAAADTKVTLTDKDGNVIISFSPAQSFNIVIISTPDMIKGESYTIKVGDQSGSFVAN